MRVGNPDELSTDYLLEVLNELRAMRDLLLQDDEAGQYWREQIPDIIVFARVLDRAELAIVEELHRRSM
jgi:hypothetical protein